MIINGKEIAEALLEELEVERAQLGRPLALGILMSSGSGVTESFIKIKSRAAHRLGVEVIRHELDLESSTEDALAALHILASKTQGIIVQLPLSPRIDVEAVLAHIPPEKDVDAIGQKPHTTPAPVARAIMRILDWTHTDVRGKKAVMVGAGRLVGKPTAELLTIHGANVTFVTKEIGSLEELKDADIAVLGAGDPGFIKPEMLKPGVVLIDAGTSELMGGTILGDADPACANMASIFTPVPGGVGPVAIAMIFKNLFELAKTHV